MGNILIIFNIHQYGKLNLFASPPVDFWFGQNGSGFLVWLQLTVAVLLTVFCATVQLFAWLWSGPGLAVGCVHLAVPVPGLNCRLSGLVICICILFLSAVWSGLQSCLV